MLHLLKKSAYGYSPQLLKKSFSPGKEMSLSQRQKAEGLSFEEVAKAIEQETSRDSGNTLLSKEFPGGLVPLVKLPSDSPGARSKESLKKAEKDRRQYSPYCG